VNFCGNISYSGGIIQKSVCINCLIRNLFDHAVSSAAVTQVYCRTIKWRSVNEENTVRRREPG
jgi:hypothetical protein